MWPYVVSALVGALVMQRRVPDTPVRKLDCIGPRTGERYRVEEFVGTSCLVVRKNGTSVMLRKNVDRAGYHPLNVRSSDPNLVKMIFLDFCSPEPEPLPPPPPEHL